MEDRLLQTARCKLRRVSRDDVPHIWSASQHPGFTDGMTWEPPSDPSEIQLFINEAEEAWYRGDRFIWAVESLEDGSFIGLVETCLDPDLPGRTWGLGYWIHPMHWKKGYATESAQEVLRYTFNMLHADSVVSSHADWNSASGNVLRKIGMRETGETVGRVIKNGIPRRSIEFQLDRTDWLNRSSD